MMLVIHVAFVRSIRSMKRKLRWCLNRVPSMKSSTIDGYHPKRGYIVASAKNQQRDTRSKSASKHHQKRVSFRDNNFLRNGKSDAGPVKSIQMKRSPLRDPCERFEISLLRILKDSFFKDSF